MKLRLIVFLALSVLAVTLLAGCATTLATEPQAAAPVASNVPTMPMTGTMPGMDHTMPMTGTMAGMDHTMPMTGTMPAGHDGHHMAPTMPMTDTMTMSPDGMAQMMHDMQGLMGRMDDMHTMMMTGMPMTGAMSSMQNSMPMTHTMPMSGTMPMTHTMPMTGTMPMMQGMSMHGDAMGSGQMMGRMMIMMGHMMQTMGHMQVMMAGGAMEMDHTSMMGQMPMMGAQSGGHGMMAGGAMGMGNMPMMGAQSGGQGMCQDGSGCPGMSGSQTVTGTLPTTSTLPTLPGTTASTVTATEAGRFPTVTAEAGGVTASLTPINLDDLQASSLDFLVALDTHTVDLGVDLASLATLKVGGRDVPASSWQAPAGGGHHVSGLLSFPAVDAAGKPTLEAANTVTLVIRNLAGVPLRTFTWTLGDS